MIEITEKEIELLDNLEIVQLEKDQEAVEIPLHPSCSCSCFRKFSFLFSLNILKEFSAAVLDLL